MNPLKLTPLGKVANVVSGYAFKSESFSDDGVPVIKIANIKNGQVVFGQGEKEFLSHDFLQTTGKKFHVVKGDVLVSLTGSHITQPNSVVGRVARYTETFTSLLNQRAGKLVIRAEVDADLGFLYYLLSTRVAREEIAMLAHGAANQANVSPKDIEKLKFYFPPNKDQQKIAAVLSAYDDLIENNKRRIALLEKMAEEIYREWFVRLRFPGHGLVKVVKGVPEGWEQKPSSDVLDVLSGGTPKTDIPAYWDGQIPFFTPKDAADNFYVLNTEKNTTENGLRTCNSRLYQKNTIFITARGTVGKLVLTNREMAMNQSCYALLPKSGKDIYFYFLTIKTALSYIKGVSKSGVFDNIIVDTFKVVPLLMPSDGLINQFNEMIGPIFQQTSALLQTNENLTATRDRLLPRLISGKLSVENLDILFPPGMEM